MHHFTFLIAFALSIAAMVVPAHAAGLSNSVTICHKPGSPAEKTLNLPQSAIQGHLNHGDQLNACEERPLCTAPPQPLAIDPGTEPRDDEPEWISESVAKLEGASETGFNSVSTPVTFRLSCPTLAMNPDTVIVYDNGLPLPFEALTLTSNSVTITNGLGSGRHELNLLAQDVFGFTIEATAILWAGEFSIPVLVLDEAGMPAAGITVVARLADDPNVTASLVTDANGRGTFAHLPNRSYNFIANASGNRIATQSASVFDGTVTLRLLGFNPASIIDNNDFSQGTEGWEIGTAPVEIVPHVENLQNAPLALSLASQSYRQPRTDQGSRAAASVLMAPASQPNVAASDFDLVLNTAGEGQQSISRTFNVEEGVKSISVRYRFITSEVPGGYFGSEFNDFFNVSVRTQQGGGSIINGNSMNGLGLATFDAGGATDWFETELEIPDGGDTVQVDLAVANVADGLLDSQVVVDAVKKNKLTVSQLQLNDIDNTSLNYLSASDHTYFSGNTRVHGTITLKGPKEDTLEELKLEVLEGGGVIATGELPSSLADTLLRPFGDTGEIKLSSTQFLFDISANQLAAADQSTNGQLTLRVKARSSSGETAQKDFGSVTKLTHFTGGNRYGGRDTDKGGDDWPKPGVRTFVDNTNHTWGDFSNMNGGSFPPHQTHRTGNSADGHFSGYNARDAATAAAIIGDLNTYRTRIRTVYVTFAPNSVFANAIANVTLTDGRTAKSVIRNVGGHTTHFHWEVTDN